jgi:hypothetical protein
MNEQPAGGGESLSLSLLKRVDQVCSRFEEAWKAGRRPRIEDYLKDASGPVRFQVLRQLLQIDVAYRRQMQETLGPEEYVLRFPECAELIQAVFAEEAFGQASQRVADSSLQWDSTRPESISRGEEPVPTRLGRYRITGNSAKVVSALCTGATTTNCGATWQSRFRTVIVYRNPGMWMPIWLRLVSWPAWTTRTSCP